MKISIKLGGAAFALDMGPADFRAVRDILIAVVLALPATQPALEELRRAVAAQFATWSPLAATTEIRAGNIKSGEVRPGEVR